MAIVLMTMIHIHAHWWYLPLALVLLGALMIFLAFRRLAEFEAIVYVGVAYLMFFAAFALVVGHWI